MSVRAKFKVNSIKRGTSHKAEKQEDGTYKHIPTELHTIEMNPVYGNGDPNHENTKFWESTPSGQFILSTVNPEAGKQFELHGEYYIDITPAPTQS